MSLQLTYTIVNQKYNLKRTLMEYILKGNESEISENPQEIIKFQVTL